MENEELFADLFAYRVYLEDIYDNENDIIKKLKIKLYYLNIEISKIGKIKNTAAKNKNNKPFFIKNFPWENMRYTHDLYFLLMI